MPIGLRKVIEGHDEAVAGGMGGQEMARHARGVYERVAQWGGGGGREGSSKGVKESLGDKRKREGAASGQSGKTSKKGKGQKEGGGEREEDPNAPTRQTLKSSTEVTLPCPHPLCLAPALGIRSALSIRSAVTGRRYSQGV